MIQTLFIFISALKLRQKRGKIKKIHKEASKTTKTLNINSAWAIEQLEASNELYLEFGDNGEGSALYYFNISQTPQPIIE